MLNLPLLRDYAVRTQLFVVFLDAQPELSEIEAYGLIKSLYKKEFQQILSNRLVCQSSLGQTDFSSLF